MKGKYPKDFKWTGWHPNDLCYVIPIIKTEEQFWLPESERGKDNAEITDVPQGFKTWVANNQDRIARAEKRGTLPYFVRDNRERVKKLGKLQDRQMDNKMAMDKGMIIGIVNFSIKEKNQIASRIMALSNKTNLFPKNITIEFNDNPIDGTLMSMIDGNKLVISQARFKMSNGTIFSPSENLRDAIVKLGQGKTLSFNEEYSIESLFHESIHSKSTKRVEIPKGSQREAIMEACVQLYARDRYTKVMKTYGVNPINFAKIQTDGYGYQRQVSMIRELFTKEGNLQVGELINIANETEDGVRIINMKLRKKGYSKIDILDFWELFKMPK